MTATDLADLFTPDDPTDAVVATLDAAIDERARLRRALSDALAHLEANTTPPADRYRAWRELTGVPAHDQHNTPEERRDEGTARAARRWTDEEVAQVDAAIRTVARLLWDGFARSHASAYVSELTEYPGRSDACIEFTADNVWRELGPGFPVTKGLTGRLIAAKNAGVIANTGRTVIADRGGTHDHGQRLTVWRAVA